MHYLIVWTVNPNPTKFCKVVQRLSPQTSYVVIAQWPKPTYIAMERLSCQSNDHDAQLLTLA